MHQNFGHVQTLKECLPGFADFQYVSIVVFTLRATLKVHVRPDAEVVSTNDLVRTIERYTDAIVPSERVDALIAKIRALNITDPAVRKAHVVTAQAQKLAKEQMIQNNICPRCGGTLIAREGKYGSFKGCSNYPKCRFKAQ